MRQNHVNLGFHRGAELDDPDGLLEGSGKLISGPASRAKAAAKKEASRKR